MDFQIGVKLVDFDGFYHKMKTEPILTVFKNSKLKLIKILELIELPTDQEFSSIDRFYL